MNNITAAFEGYNEKLLNAVHTQFPARVLSYNMQSHTCTLQPLYKFSNGLDYPQLQNVPVSFYRIYEYGIPQRKNLILQVNDVVLCGCCEKSIDSVHGSSRQAHMPISKRRFDISDAVVLSIIY